MHLVLYRVGAWCWLVTGIGHLIGEVLLRPPSSPAGAAMADHYVDMLGLRRSLMELMTGFGVAMGLAIALAGVLFLLIARLAADAPERARTAAFAGLAASAILLALALAVLPPPPIVTFTLASLAFAAALVVTPRRVRPGVARRGVRP